MKNTVFPPEIGPDDGITLVRMGAANEKTLGKVIVFACGDTAILTVTICFLPAPSMAALLTTISESDTVLDCVGPLPIAKVPIMIDFFYI